MATKNATKKATPKKSLLIKIAGQVGHLAGELTSGKNHLMGMAGDAIDSVKESLHLAKKKNAPVKAVKKAVQAVTKKAVSKAAIKPAAKKIAKPLAKKAAPVKKAIKKAVKKAVGKK